MEVFKWMALPETQKAISVCHIQAVCDSDGLPDAFCGTMCFAMHRNISLNSPKSRRGSQRNLSAVVFKGNYVKSHLPDVWKWQNCIFVAGKNEPLLHSIILFLMWWLRHFTSKCEQVTTGFHSTNCGSSALRREKKKSKRMTFTHALYDVEEPFRSSVCLKGGFVLFCLKVQLYGIWW